MKVYVVNEARVLVLDHVHEIGVRTVLNRVEVFGRFATGRVELRSWVFGRVNELNGDEAHAAAKHFMTELLRWLRSDSTQVFCADGATCRDEVDQPDTIR